jgi:hypothetical protein
LGIPVGISFGTIYGDCDNNPEDCSGPVPYRTIVMLISLICHFLISTLTHYLFVEEKIPQKYDFFGCYKVSSTTGLVEQASSRHLDNANGTITLDELASNGSFIPRPEYTNGQKY